MTNEATFQPTIGHLGQIRGATLATPTTPPVIQFPKLRTIDIPMSDVQVERIIDEDGRKQGYRATIDGVPLSASQRFKSSIMGVIGQGISTLNLFDFDELVTRFQERNPKKAKRVKLTIDETNGMALAAVSPGRFLPDMEETLGLIQSLDGRVSYSNGELLAFCKPAMETSFTVLNDAHQIRNSFRIPLDGYGAPMHYVGMVREICTNGLIAWGKVWSTICTFGKKTDPSWAMERFIKTISNVEAETRLRDRLNVATDTLASLDDISKLLKQLNKSEFFDAGPFLSMVLDADLSVTEADMNQFSSKERSRIGSRVTVYDLINMATEAFTHYGVLPAASFLGDVLQGSFDLEGVDTNTASTRISEAKENNPAFWLNKCMIPNGRGMGVIPDLETIQMRTFSRVASPMPSLDEIVSGELEEKTDDSIEEVETDDDDFADFESFHRSVVVAEPASN